MTARTSLYQLHVDTPLYQFIDQEVLPGTGVASVTFWKGFDQLVQDLARQSFAFDATASDPERNCWLVVHRHAHGVLPSEYDIREVPEDLYLAVLDQRRRLRA